MIRVLTRSIILLLSLMAVHKIIRAEDDDDDDDAALAKINSLFFRSRRRVSSEDVTSVLRDSNSKRDLEWKLSDLLEFDRTATKLPIVRQDSSDDDIDATGISTTEVERFDPVDKDEQEGRDVSAADYAGDEETELHKTTKNPGKLKTAKPKAGLIHRIGQKLIDRKTKFTISLPVAIVTVGSIIILTCCCSLYIRNRLVACIDTLLGRNKKKKKKLLAVDTERGRSTPRSKKRRVKSVSLSKKRARSLSLDTVNIGTQKSATTSKDVEEPSSTTGCYQCCKKKKKRGKNTKK